MKREECECDLQFAGFVVIACPLKSDSKAAIKQIQESSHHVSIGAAQTATSSKEETVTLLFLPFRAMKIHFWIVFLFFLIVFFIYIADYDYWR